MRSETSVLGGNKKAFTFIELIIVVVILTILWAIWMISFVSSLEDARDSSRISSILLVESALKTHYQKRWSYPNPWSMFEIQYSGTWVAFQWKLDRNVRLSTLEKIPVDPKNWINYSYSITRNKQEFEISATLENWGFPIALLTWNYRSVSKNILPTIIVATNSTIDIQNSPEKDLFVFNQNYHNLVYDFINNLPYNSWISFDILLEEAKSSNNFWQSSDFRNCIEIKKAGKLIVPVTHAEFEYQIVDNNWVLTNTWCTISNSN